MPFNPISGVVTRIWKFVDQFTARDYALRSVFDQAFDDVVGSFNAALAYFFKNYSTRAEFEAATIPANVLYVFVAGLAYVRDTAGTAITSANGVKFSPFGTIMPEHWATNTTPFTTDMSAACLAMGRWLAATNGPHRRVYWGNIGVSSPIKLGIGDGTAAWSGYISNITFIGGQIRSIGSTRWAGVASSGILAYPASLIILAGDTTYSSENIKFENTKFDGRYICGGIYLENTNKVTILDNFFVGIGIQGAGIRTSIVDSAVNVDGLNAKNTEFSGKGNKVRGGNSSASAPAKRSLDGLCASQTATSGTPLTLNGADISGGEWVSPDGYASVIGLRVDSGNPGTSAGKRVTVNGFADIARTVPLSQQITAFEWSTQWQHTTTDSGFCVVTSIVPDDTFSQNVALRVSRETTGIWVESADFRLSENSIDGVSVAEYFNNFFNGDVYFEHPWSEKVVVGDNCHNLKFFGVYWDFTDPVLYSHDHAIDGCYFRAGNPTAHLISSTGHTSGDGFSFQGNRATTSRTFSTDGQLLKFHNGATPFAAYLNMTVSGNYFAGAVGEEFDIVQYGRTRNYAMVSDGNTIPGYVYMREDSSGGLILNTDSNGLASSGGDHIYLAKNKVVHADLRSTARYLFGVGKGTAGAASFTLRADDATFAIFPNGNASQGIIWNDTYDAIEFIGQGIGILARSPDNTLYRLAPPNGGGAATWVAP